MTDEEKQKFQKLMEEIFNPVLKKAGYRVRDPKEGPWARERLERQRKPKERKANDKWKGW